MKSILDLTKAINNEAYFNKQFSNWGEEKNILFVNPQLSGKCLYKIILPFFSIFNEKVATAISGISKYDYEGQILGGDEINISEEMIDWSDFIVFPFTTQPLVSEFYDKIRSIKPDVKIIFLIDFNFYVLSDLHPYKHIFDEPTALSATEDNIWFADICLTSNPELTHFMVNKFRDDLSKNKYSEHVSYLSFASMPYMIDTEIILKNIEFDPMKPVLFNPNEHDPEIKKRINEVAEVAEEIKEADIADKNKKQADVSTEEESEIKPEAKSEDNSNKKNIEEDKLDSNKGNLTANKNGIGKKYIKKHGEPKPKSAPRAKLKKPSPKPEQKSKSGKSKRTTAKKRK